MPESTKMGWVDDRRESELAWQLADVIRSVLSDSDRAHLYGVIGAGESYAAIDAASKTIVSERFPIAPELIVALLAWVDAYAHSDDAARLRQLLRSVTTVSWSRCCGEIAERSPLSTNTSDP